MTTVTVNQPDRLQQAANVMIPVVKMGDTMIKNTFFFPDVDPKPVRRLIRFESPVSAAHLRNAIKMGIAETNAELYDYRIQQIAAGFEQLASVPGAKIDGKSERVFHYLKAVTAMAIATLYERHHHADNTAGDRKTDNVERTIEQLWCDMRRSVSYLQSQAHCMMGQR